MPFSIEVWYDADTAPQQGGNLIAQRFTAAGRHQHQCIAPGRNMLDDGLLRAAKGCIAEYVVEDLLWSKCSHDEEGTTLRLPHPVAAVPIPGWLFEQENFNSEQGLSMT